MEIQGSWIPLDVLKYIASLLYIENDCDSLRLVCKAFCRAVNESVVRRRVRIFPTYGTTEHGLVTTVKHMMAYTKRFKVVYTHPGGLIDFTLRHWHKEDLCILSKIRYPGTVRQRRSWCMISEDLEHFCADTGRIDADAQLLNGDRKDIAEEILWLYHVIMQQFAVLYERANGKRVLKHKRPRKRVKRLGFDED